MANPGNRGLEIVLLVVPVAAMASSVIFLRLSGLGAAEVSFWRLLLGGIALGLMGGGSWRSGAATGAALAETAGEKKIQNSGLRGILGVDNGVFRVIRECWRAVLLGGFFLGAHFVTWVAGARATSAANATLLVNLVPLVLPWLLWWIAAERVRRTDWAGAALGVAGVLVVVGAKGGGGDWRGDLMCLGSMFLLAAYLALGRRAAASFPSSAAWTVPVFLTGALVCGVVEVATNGWPDWPSAREWIWIACLVGVPTLLGHALVNRALRVWRGQVVGVATTGQFLFAGVYAWVVFGELPGPLFPVGAALVLGGVVVVGRGR